MCVLFFPLMSVEVMCFTLSLLSFRQEVANYRTGCMYNVREGERERFTSRFLEICRISFFGLHRCLLYNKTNLSSKFRFSFLLAPLTHFFGIVISITLKHHVHKRLFLSLFAFSSSLSSLVPARPSGRPQFWCFGLKGLLQVNVL